MNDSIKPLPQPGEQWVMRSGAVTGPLQRGDNPKYPLTDGNDAWTEDGHYHISHKAHRYDLISRCKVVVDGAEASPDAGLTSEEKAQINIILVRCANEVEEFADDCRQNTNRPWSVEFALRREIARLRDLADKVAK